MYLLDLATWLKTTRKQQRSARHTQHTAGQELLLYPRSYTASIVEDNAKTRDSVGDNASCNNTRDSVSGIQTHRRDLKFEAVSVTHVEQVL